MIIQCVVCGEEKDHHVKGKCRRCYERERYHRPDVKAKQQEYSRERYRLMKEHEQRLKELTPEELIQYIQQQWD